MAKRNSNCHGFNWDFNLLKYIPFDVRFNSHASCVIKRSMSKFKLELFNCRLITRHTNTHTHTISIAENHLKSAPLQFEFNLNLNLSIRRTLISSESMINIYIHRQWFQNSITFLFDFTFIYFFLNSFCLSSLENFIIEIFTFELFRSISKL